MGERNFREIQELPQQDNPEKNFVDADEVAQRRIAEEPEAGLEKSEKLSSRDLTHPNPKRKEETDGLDQYLSGYSLALEELREARITRDLSEANGLRKQLGIPEVGPENPPKQ